MKSRKNERGSASTKMIIVAVVIFLVGHAGYKYVPVAYGAESLQQDMHTAVMQATALPTSSNPVEFAKNQIIRSGLQNGMPPGTPVEVKASGGIVTAHLKFSQKISLLPFGVGNYTYEFDKVVSPGGLMEK
jgi:hypothetical protein